MRFVVVIIALLSCPASACGFPASELRLGGVQIGDTESSVIELLGDPSERVETGEGTELRYPGLVLTIGWPEQAAPGVERRVFAGRAEGRAVCTPKGLCPGMGVAEAVRLYGPAESTERESGTQLEYQPEGEHCWLQVQAPADTVLSLAVACQP